MLLVRCLYGLGIALFALLLACSYGDVGAPCSHGNIEPIPTRRITFPALSCNDLLCVYAEEPKLPSGECTSDADCNKGGESGFTCDGAEQGSGTCRVSVERVLQRSMCSKKCASDDDCRNTGASSKKRPVAKDAACQSGFTCTRIQKLGEFCCDPMCVCNDYLDSDATNRECLDDQVVCPDDEAPEGSAGVESR